MLDERGGHGASLRVDGDQIAVVRSAQYGSRSLRFNSLPVGSARQLVHEVDRAGPLELGQASGEVLHDRRPQRVVGGHAFAHLDDRLDLLAHVVVGDAEDGHVGDLRDGR